jgi:hypothetical protein
LYSACLFKRERLALSAARSAPLSATLNRVFIVSQGCQMAYFQTKNPNLDIFWRAS